MEEQNRQANPAEKQPEVRRPDEVVEDLEPDTDEADALKGGSDPTGKPIHKPWPGNRIGPGSGQTSAT
jgi:hypothetical protein